MGGLAKAAAASMAAALEGAMDAHLKPLLPEGFAEAVAAASSSKAHSAALARQLPPPLSSFGAADVLLSGTGDDRWLRYSEAERLATWRSWIDERVWGKQPAAPVPSAGRAVDQHSSRQYPQQQQQEPARKYDGSRMNYERREHERERERNGRSSGGASRGERDDGGRGDEHDDSKRQRR